MEDHNDLDAAGRRHRSNGNHMVGDSMPGTVGDAQRVLHDAQGQTPAHQPDTHVPSEETTETEETTEVSDAEIETLFDRL